MAAVDAGSWARLRLVQGASDTPSIELDGSEGPLRLTVGAHPGCRWVVRDPSVAPTHLTLSWDGITLEVADCHGAGGVRLDGQRVSERFTRVYGRSRIEFGRCAIVAETSVGVGQRRQPPTGSSVPPPSSAANGTAGSSAPPARSRSSRPLARTLMGVAPSSHPPPGEEQTPDSVKVSLPVRAGASSAPPEEPSSPRADPTPTGPRQRERPEKLKSTVMGMAPVPAAESSASASPTQPSASPPGGEGELSPAAGAKANLGSTLYGLGRAEQVPHAVEVVSSERLRRSSVPPAHSQKPASPGSEPPAGPRKLGRTTRLGFAEALSEEEPSQRATHPGFAEPGDAAGEPRAPEQRTVSDTRLVDDTGRLRQMARDGDVVHRSAWEQSDEPSGPLAPHDPAQLPWPPPPPPEGDPGSPGIWPTVVGIVAFVAFGIWVYALLTL